MKQIFTLSLILLGFTAFSQQKNAGDKTSSSTSTEQKNTETTNNAVRNSSVSVQSRTSQATPLPYNVDDKYMGRKAEFLGNLTVTELPSDFPVYEKQLDLKAYNNLVTSYYLNHMNIVRKEVRQKLESTKR
jgi:hypothetical protein